MTMLLPHEAIEQTMFKMTSLNEYVRVVEAKYFNMWRRKIKSSLFAESGIDNLQKAEVYQQDRNAWVKLKSTTERKVSEEGYFQKSIISWIVTFGSNEKKSFRLVLMWKRTPIPCLLTHAFCSKEVEPSLRKVFVGYASKPKHFKKEMLKKTIKRILRSLGFEALLWEDKTKTGDFYCKICRDIQESFFTLFEFSEKNLNIAFEFGLAIAINKEYFILKKSKSEVLPADIGHLDRIEFGTYKELTLKLKKQVEDRYSIIFGLGS